MKFLKKILLCLSLSPFNFVSPQGKVVILNGTSTAGKSTILAHFDPSFQHIALDDFIPAQWAEFIEKKTGKKVDGPENLHQQIESNFSLYKEPK